MNIYRLIIACVLLGMMATCRAEQNSPDWLTVEDRDLSIQAGSALDFSKLVESGVAGQHGRVIRGIAGHLAYADSPNTPRRFFCASQPHGTVGHFPDHATADRYARQVRLHGYNAVRFHFVEHDLMTKQTQDFQLNPEQLDRFYYLLAAFKREGVYWLLDGMTSWNGLYGDVGKNRWVLKHNLKLGVHFDEQAKAHWRRLVNQVFNQVNPYTQLSPLQDPALMGFILVNEGGLNHVVNVLSGAELSELRKVDQAFMQWLTVKYGSTSKAFSVWGESLGPVGIVVPIRDWNASQRVRDSQLFYYETEKNTLQWMTAYLRGLGYQGLISAYDNWANLQDSASRQSLEWIDMHAYQDEPSDWVSAGSSLKQESSFSQQLSYIRDLAMSRYWFKPFTVSEYDQPFWDTSRYETGLAIGAYASFQDWDMICRHSSAIELAYGEKGDSKTRQAIHPFEVGMDPIARADETLAALLFARQDVKTAQHKVDIRLSSDYVFNRQAGIGKLPEEISNIALVTGLGLSWQQGLGEKADMLITPDNLAPTIFDKIIAKLKKWFGLSNHHWLDRLVILKQNAILSARNASNNQGIFQSDTEEITLNSHDQLLSVMTDKTEAVAFKTLPPPLAKLKITSASDPALFAVSSLDGLALAQSKRLLLIYATDARNSGMTFSDSRARVLNQLGTLPVQIKNSHIAFSLDNINAANLHLYALRLNGSRGVELPIHNASNTINAELDLSAMSKMPTTYFELATN